MKIFGTGHVFRKWDETQFEERLNRACLTSSRTPLRTPLFVGPPWGAEDEVVKAFKKLCLDTEFRTAIESTTKSKKAVKDRFTKWYQVLGEAIGEKIQVALPQ